MLCTANYAARRFGVRAAMPGFIGLRLCPELVLVAPNFQKYQVVAEQTRSIFKEFDPEFEAMSLDEAYLDLTAYLESHADINASQLVDRIRREIFEATGLTASAGIAYNPMLAKICSDKNKPNGQVRSRLQCQHSPL